MSDPNSGTPRHSTPSNPSEASEVSERQTSSAPTRETRARVLWGDGAQWRVREAEFPVQDRRTGRSLIFETDEIIRRVRDYPASWFNLPDDELYRLSLGKAAER